MSDYSICEAVRLFMEYRSTVNIAFRETLLKYKVARAFKKDKGTMNDLTHLIVLYSIMHLQYLKKSSFVKT